jgi:type II restriction/modification system DNA methylase subunit YeeA
MTPDEFITTWTKSELKESAGAATHFNDLCALLGLDPPHKADPKGEWFTFEKGATKTNGGEGWADVWRRDCFAWEYKGKKKDLDRAFAQLQQYAVALDNPPLLIVSDMERIRIHTNWTNTVSERHDLALQDLRDAAKRDLLRNCFTNPEALKPVQTRQALTEQVATNFAAIADRLRKRGHHPHDVAHFVNRLVFCMFAEDVGLLPNKLFEGLIKNSRGAAGEKTFPARAAMLFETMRKGGLYGNDEIDVFNGGLFENDATLPLTYQDLDDLYRITQPNWSDIDPSILGTLFERGLDPDKRSQLGAHYTDRGKIMQIITPVIIQPLLAEWAQTRQQIESLLPHNMQKAQALRAAFAQRLANFRVLDPACGSGNFLYLSLIELKNIEHRMNVEAEALGLPKGHPKIGPESVLGIELNPYAAELARVSVWIGEIQWMRRNGFEVAKNPILRSLNTIENRDAVLAPDGTRAAWPPADAVVGNPPFLGGSKILSELGDDYAAALRKAWDGTVPGFADLVCYWFAQAWGHVSAGHATRAGLVATNSIRGGANREVLKPIVEGGRIFEAWADEPWTVDGAAVRVSMVCFDGEKGGAAQLNGQAVPQVHADLTGAGTNLTLAVQLKENADLCFEGMKKYGAFDVSGATARDWLQKPLNVNGLPNAQVLRRLVNAMEIVRRPEERWVVDFSDYPSEREAAEFEAPFAHCVLFVYPERQKVRDEKTKQDWWLFERPRPNLRAKIKKLGRFIITPRVAKHRVFIWCSVMSIPDTAIDAIARDDDTTFGILHSRFHELWSLRMGTSLEDRPRYTPSTTFETFPFPAGLTPNIPAADYAQNPHAQAIAAVAAELNARREFWLNPPDITIRLPEVVPGYPDRILPKDAQAARELKSRTLTNLYNKRPTWLLHLHAALDRAVAQAYGWGDDWDKGMSDEDILSRLFALNQQRAAGQA